MYELCPAVWAMTVLSQDIIRLVAQEMTTMRTNIVALELTIELLASLWHFGGVLICLNEKDKGNDDSQTIEQQIPEAASSRCNT